MPNDDPFPETRWTLVRRARGGEGEAARRAMGEICAMYWFPLYAYARRSGRTPEEAEDLVQGFFAEILSRGAIGRADEARGKLRAFLLGSFKHFIASEARREGAQKRGGGARPISLDAGAAEQRYATEPADRRTPDQLYERRWALDLIARAMAALEAEFADREKAGQFAALKPHLEWNPGGASYVEIAAQLGMTPGAVQAAVKRLRHRFRTLLEREIAETVARPGDVAEELRCLILALG
ncbi:MAG: winged helix-turn-helix transcriptional regulator [Verrucomicrobiales bacterium]